MRTRTRVAAGAIAALLLLGCAAKAVIKQSVGAGSPFCNDVGAAATKVAVLADAANQSRAYLLQVLPGIQTSLANLARETPAADTVNAKPLKADVATLARVAADIIAELQRESDVSGALKVVHAKDGQALTDAAGRFDDYAGTVCHVTEVGPSTPASTSTTVGPAGPTPPTSAATPTT